MIQLNKQYKYKKLLYKQYKFKKILIYKDKYLVLK